MRYLIRLSHRPTKLSLPGLLLALLLISGVGLLACGPAATPVPPPSPTASPTPGTLERPAPIESVGIEVGTADPAAADLVVVSGLPNACYIFGHYSLTREGDTFRVEIINLISDDPMLACAEIYGMITTRIPLEGGVETCEFYEVVANGTPYSVQAIAPNVRCMGTPGQGTGSGQWPEDSVVLAFGQKTPISGTDLELTLIEVPEDSRCPSDVVCVWAGRATVVLRVELEGRESPELSLSTDGGSPDEGSTDEGVAGRSASVDGHVIELLQLEPYPVSTRQIPMEEYAARVSVTGDRSCAVKCSG